MTGQTKDYRIPKRFVDDHDSRDCLRDDAGESITLASITVRTTKKHLVVRMTDAQASELMSDAWYYKDLAGELGWDGMSLVVSARATYDALLKQGVPCPHGGRK